VNVSQNGPARRPPFVVVTWTGVGLVRRRRVVRERDASRARRRPVTATHGQQKAETDFYATGPTPISRRAGGRCGRFRPRFRSLRATASTTRASPRGVGRPPRDPEPPGPQAVRGAIRGLVPPFFFGPTSFEGSKRTEIRAMAGGRVSTAFGLGRSENKAGGPISTRGRAATTPRSRSTSPARATGSRRYWRRVERVVSKGNGRRRQRAAMHGWAFARAKPAFDAALARSFPREYAGV